MSPPKPAPKDETMARTTGGRTGRSSVCVGLAAWFLDVGDAGESVRLNGSQVSGLGGLDERGCVLGGDHRVLVHPGDAAGQERCAGQEPDLGAEDDVCEIGENLGAVAGRSRSSKTPRSCSSSTASALTAASRIASAIERLTMIVPSRGRIVSRISAAVATMARAARSALRRAVTRFTP